jgi:hypothetical protein
MPLTVNVGLSRKASENYQSAGISINLAAELDQSLLARPDQLQQQIDQIYALAEAAVERQATRLQSTQANRTATEPRAAGNGASTRNGSNGRSNGQHEAAMTESQSRAILAIAKRMGIDPAAECRNLTGCELAKLTVRQASELIDHLKAQPAGKGSG